MLAKYSQQRNIPPGLLNVFHNGIEDLVQYYDWIGVRALAPYLSRQWDSGANKQSYVNYLDLLTAIDQLMASGMAVPTEELYRKSGERSQKIYRLGPERLPNVKKCLMQITSSIQRVCIQTEPGRMDPRKIEPYWRVALGLAELMVEEARAYSNHVPNSRQFYLYSYSMVSFNWDPIMLWLLFNAHDLVNRKKNRIRDRFLRLYDDGGDGIGIHRLESEEDPSSNDLLAFLMSEPVCRRINGKRFDFSESHYFRLGKFLFPHGGIGWRVCPRCGKLITTLGQKLGDIHSSVAFGPDLLPEINKAWTERTLEEKKSWDNFYFGAVQCVFCGFVTQPSDAPLILQSAIKSERHYVLEGIFREMGLLFGNARHAVFAGYTLPPDDVIYRSFFMSSQAGKLSSEKRQYCSLVTFDSEFKNTSSDPWIKKRRHHTIPEGSSRNRSSQKHHPQPSSGI